MTPPAPAEADTATRTTPRRDYVIFARVVMSESEDGKGVETVYYKELASWSATSHEAALRGWGEDNTAVAAQYTHGFIVATASSVHALAGFTEPRFVVRPLS